MTYEEAIQILNKNRELCMFNPLTGDNKPMNEDCRLSASALDLAIKALEKQIPKKAYDIDYDINRETISFDCPSCLSSLYAEDELENVGYCCVCGQALDWSATE